MVQCYNFDGIPLTLVNTTHNSTTGGLISINSPHSYHLKITNKTATTGITGGGSNITVSQNVPWDAITPQIQSQLEPKTSMVTRLLGTSGTSCGPFPSGASAETSFTKDTTYIDVTVGAVSYTHLTLPTKRIV